jgi:hypothetical protein
MTRTQPFVLAIYLALTVLGARTARAADPTTAECLAANEASLSARSQQKLREARSKLLVCASRSCPADVRDECTRGVNELNGALPTIVFEAKDGTGADLIAVKVTMDGEVLTEHLEGTAIPVDPGAHTFAFEAAGQPKIEKQLVIREGEKGRRERIVLGAGAAVAETSAPGATLTSSPAPEPSSGLGGRRIGALVAGGVGVVAAGVGIGFGLHSKSKHDEASKICPDPQCPDMNGVTLWNQAVSAGNIATGAFVAGAVGIAAGVTLWILGAPESPGGGTQVGFGPGTLQLRGSF